jgi:5'-nucleotidase
LRRWEGVGLLTALLKLLANRIRLGARTCRSRKKSVTKPLILLTNDDGIISPGLAASAAALDPLGDLLIVAPRTQQSGTGRSMPLHHDGRIFETTVTADGRTWPAYAANASPALAVQHAVMELTDRRPALAVSGINFGENVGTSVTISGTVGAALEAAAHGIPALAVSIQVDVELAVKFELAAEYDSPVDFSAAIHFTRLFAARWLSAEAPPDVDALKIEIPQNATPDTPWRITRLEREHYYLPVPPRRKNLGDKARFGYTKADPVTPSDGDTDVGALLEGVVSVTPLSLDMTSRVERDVLREVLGGGG